MAATEIAFFTERLAQKEQELGEVKSAFHEYKLKQKVKYDKLRKEVNSHFGGNVVESENAAMLQIRVAELETELEEARNKSESLSDELAKRQTQINDHMILIKNLENQLKAMTPLEKIDRQEIDIEKIQQQMKYKDERIVELNSVILEKERQILDLQELCREQGEVASSKTQAMRIVQKKFEEMENRGKREVATETDPWPTVRSRERDAAPKGASRSLSPGHAVVSRGAGGSSPPPLDPQDVEDRLLQDDDFAPGPSGFQGKNLDGEMRRSKDRKRVTFDLPPSATNSTMNLNSDPAVYDQLNQNITRLSEENAKLVDELTASKRILEEKEMEVAKILRDGKNSALKVKAAHSRIREFEQSLALANEEHLREMNRLQTEIDTLRNTRDWALEQNGQLHEQLEKFREKNTKLTAEVDATGKLNYDLENKVADNQALLDSLAMELEEAETLVVFMEDQKQTILEDVEKMKEAILAQDQFISLLEADIVIYEEHVGLLRDSLGASKVDHRSLLRSKAFETKLRALEQEKEQISIKSREEKLRTKALAQKVKILEEENEKLMEKLCEKEMGADEDAEMVETCRQLEARLREADDRMRLERTQFEIELETARVENKQRITELEELRFQLNVHERRQDNQYQTMVAPEVSAQQAQESQELRDQVAAQEEKIRDLKQQVTALEAELDTVRVLNFELQDQVKEAEQTEVDYDELIEKHRITCQELVAAKEKLGEIDRLTTTISTLEESNQASIERAEQAEREITQLKTELDASRVSFSETAAVKKELQYLQSELERERTIGQQKWEEFCKKALEGGYSEPGSRKSSMEIQKEQYIIAFEEKIEKLEEELQVAKTQIATEEQQKMELQRKLTEKEEATHVQSSNDEDAVSVQRLQELEAAFAAREVELEKKIKDLEIENGLAAELGIEMGRVIQTYELQIKSSDQMVADANEKAHSASMELRLHEMLNEELGRELDELRETHTALKDQNDQLVASLQEKEMILAAESSRLAALEGEVTALKQETVILQQTSNSPPVVEEVVLQETVQPVQAVPETREVFGDASAIQEENEILRQCVNETIQMREDMSQDVEKLLELKNELEVAVDALKGEIWTLNGQLKASVFDREQLQDRVVELDTSLAEEKKKVASLDCELSEQVELTEKATRQAAEAENESNRRLAECHEMESRRGELEQAYAQLTDYYNQLQAAHNALYESIRSGNGLQQAAPQPAGLDPLLISVIEAIMADLQLEITPEMDVGAKIKAIQHKIREKIQELEQLHVAVSEQRKVNEALEGRMEALEANAELSGGESLELKNKLNQLEGDLEWKQEECDSLRRQVDELQHALNTVIANDGDDAAKLATRQADVDSLFRTNAELAHTNVSLQNELDEKEEDELTYSTPVAGNQEEYEALVEKVKELEQKLADWSDSKKEIERLKEIEKILNNRILSLEDQLLEKEEQLQETEEQLIEMQSANNSEKLTQLQQANSLVVEELQGLKNERETLRLTIATMEKELNTKKEEASVTQSALDEEKQSEDAELRRQLEIELERLKKEKEAEERRAAEEIKQYQEELEEMQTELEVLKQKLKNKGDETQRNSETESTWDDWGDSGEKEDKNDLQEEIDRLTAEIEEIKVEHKAKEDKMKSRIQELEEEAAQAKDEVEVLAEEANMLKEKLAEAQGAQKESDAWGWDEEKPQRGTEESKALQEEIESLRGNIERLRSKLEESEGQVAELEGQLASGQQSRGSWNDGWGEEGSGGDTELEELKQTEAELKNQLEFAQQQFAIVSVELDERKREVEELNREIENYKENEMRFEAMTSQNNGDSEKMSKLVSQLEEEKNELFQQCEDLREEIESFVEREQQLEQKVEELNNKLQASVMEMNLLKEAAATQPASEDNWADGWGESEPKTSDDSEALRQELTETQQELQETLQKVSRLTADFERSQVVITQLQEEIDLLQERQEEAVEKKTIQPSEAENAWDDDGWGEESNSVVVEDKSEEIEELRKELDVAKEELKEATETLALRTGEIERLTNEVDEAQAQIEELIAKEASLIEALGKSEVEKEKLHLVVSRTEKEEDAALTEIEDLRLALTDASEREQKATERADSAVLELEIVKQDLEDTKIALMQSSEKEKKAAEQAESLASELEIVNQDLEDTKLALIQSSEGEKKAIEELEVTSSRLVESQQEVQRLKEENIKLVSEEKTQAAEDDAWGDGWGEEASGAQEELEQCQQQLSAVSQKLSQVESALADTKQAAQERERELQRQIEELEEEQTAVESVERTQNELEEKTKELEEVQKKLVEVKKQNELLKESEGRLLESVDEWGEIAEKNEDECKRLQAIVNKLEKERLELDEELVRLRKELEALKASQSSGSDPSLMAELEKLRAERNTLRTQVANLGSKLAEVEKERAHVRNAYDQLRAKIAARRAAASNTPSRAPSVASSIGEIREDPEPVPQAALFTPTSIPQEARLSAQAFDEKIRDFVDDVKEFADRVYNFTNIRLDDIGGFEQTLNQIEMGRRGKKASKKNSSPDVVVSSTTEVSSPEPSVESVEILPEPLLEEKTCIDHSNESLLNFDVQLLVDVAGRLEEHDTELFSGLKDQVSEWSPLSDPNVEHSERQRVLGLLLPSIHSVLTQISTVMDSQQTRQEEILKKSEDSFKKKEVALKKELEDQLLLAEEQLKRLNGQLDSVTKELSDVESVRQEASSLKAEIEEERRKQETLREQVKEQDLSIKNEDDEAEKVKVELEKAREEAEVAKKRCAEVMEQGDELYHKLFEMHRENEQITVMRLELERAARKEEKMNEKFEELQAMYGTMKDAFAERLKRDSQTADEVEKQRRYTVEVENNWRQIVEEKEDQLEDMKRRLQETTEEMAKKDLQVSEQTVEMEALKTQLHEPKVVSETHQMSYPSGKSDKERALEKELEAKEEKLERLESALEIRTREIRRLEARVEELTQEVGNSHEELLNVKTQRQTMEAELNEARFNLEQAVESNEDNFAAGQRVRKLEMKLSTMEAENYEKTAQVTLQLQQYEESLLSAQMREQELVTENEALKQEVAKMKEDIVSLAMDVKTLQELSESSVAEMHNAVKEAEEFSSTSSSLLAENAELRSQLAIALRHRQVAEQQVQGLNAQLEESRNHLETVSDNDLKVRFVELEARLGEMTRQRDSLAEVQTQTTPVDTRIQMEPETSTDLQESPKVVVSDSEPLLPSHFNDVVEHVRNSTLVRAGAPWTAPFARRIRALLARRALRPYARFFFAGYFVFLHFLLLNCWFH